MPRVTKKAWFGPKRHLGWGWTIQSWPGAVASVVFVGLFALVLVLLNGTGRWIGGAFILTAFLVVVLLTGDPPGGPHMGGPGKN